MPDPIQTNRPQIQQADFNIGQNALDYMRHNIRIVVVGLALLIIIGLVLAAYLNQQRRNSIIASQMLGVAHSTAQLEKLLTQYPSAPAAPIAMLALASSQFAAQAYDEASLSYERFIQQYPQHPLLMAAELGQAMCEEAQGGSQQALLSFDLFIAKHPDSFLTPQATLGKARCLQTLELFEEAQAVYQDFIAAHSNSAWNEQMETALRQLQHTKRSAQQPQEI